MNGYEDYRAAVDKALCELPALRGQDEGIVTEPQAAPPDEGMVPQPLLSAMRYSLLLPGKRVRPTLLLAAYALLDDDWQTAMPFACAVEMIHTYSLIHDDLPAIDNDELRRGKPTNHTVFGEGMAVLAGDGLLNLAFETMLGSDIAHKRSDRALRAAAEIAARAGVTGMIAGQTLDVTLEGKEPSEASVRYIHLHKTADLLTAPVVAGLILAGAGEDALRAGRAYGRGIGLAFQIIDDLLDVEGDAGAMGKNTGMDAQRGKQTWPAVMGVESSREDARRAVSDAVEALAPFGQKGAFLADFARETLVRAG